MSDLTSSHASWRSSTSMILWGIVALTVFGCVASFCEFFFGTIDLLKSYLDRLFDFAASSGDQTHAEGFYKFYAVHGRLSIWTRIMEILTIVGWILYVVGLSKFRYAQSSDKARWLAGSLYSACWLGLIGMGCSFIGSFLGLLGLLFRFAGWVLNLISLFKFRGAFNQLSIEESWNYLAQKGARTLKASYTLGIILAFYPLIIFITTILLCLGSIGNFSNLLSSSSSTMIENLAGVIGGSVVVFILLALAAVVMWVFQVCYAICGWCRINNGGIVEMGEEEYPTDYSTWFVLGSIFTTIILICLASWTCLSPLMAKGGTYSIGPVQNEAMESSEETAGTLEEWETSHSQSSNEESTPIITEQEEEYDIGCGEDLVIYKGSIDGKYAIEMELTPGDPYTGVYFYTKNKTRIELRGRTTDDNRLILDEYVGDNLTGTFDGVISGNIYHGTWSNPDGTRSYPFSVSER